MRCLVIGALSALICTRALAGITYEEMVLCEKGTPEEIKAAMDTGRLNPQACDDSTGYTVLMWCAQFNPYSESIKALIDAGGDVCAITDDGMSAYDYAKMNMALDDPEILEALKPKEPKKYRKKTTLRLPRPDKTIKAPGWNKAAP